MMSGAGVKDRERSVLRELSSGLSRRSLYSQLDPFLVRLSIRRWKRRVK